MQFAIRVPFRSARLRMPLSHRDKHRCTRGKKTQRRKGEAMRTAELLTCRESIHSEFKRSAHRSRKIESKRQTKCAEAVRFAQSGSSESDDRTGEFKIQDAIDQNLGADA